MTCKACGGKGVLQAIGTLIKCPVCDGTGVAADPGLFFIYEGGPFVLAGNAVQNGNSIQVLDKDFRWQFAVAISTGAFTVFIRDSQRKRPFSNQAVHSSNIFGTAQNPFPILVPWTFRKRGSILFDLADISGAGNTIRVAFIGVEADAADYTTA